MSSKDKGQKRKRPCHESSEVIKCAVHDCEFSSSEKIAVQMHCKLMHDVNDSGYDADNDESKLLMNILKPMIDTTIPTFTHNEKHMCLTCGFVASNKRTFNLHVRRHTGERPYSCDLCKRTFTHDGSVARHLTRCKKKPSGDVIKKYACSACDASFDKDTHLTAHMYVHDGNPYHCNFCSYSTSYKYMLNVHVRSHTGARPYSCDLCGSSFTQSGNLLRHLAVCEKKPSSDNIKKYMCSECGVSFDKHSCLSAHMHVHGEKPYKCDVCKRTFTRSSNLTVHLFTCDKISESSDVCSTTSKKNVCSVCGISFQQNDYLLAHMRVHTNERPYNCSVCSASFHTNAYLKNHEHTHTGIRPFSCELCGYKFTRKGNLSRHLVKCKKRHQRRLV